MIKSFLFGVTIAIAVGPIALLVMSNALRRGFWSGARTALGAALADLTFGLVAFTIGAALVRVLEANRAVFEIGSSLVLIGFGIWMIAGAARAHRSPEPAQARPGAREVPTTYVLTITNPLTVIGFVAFTGQIRGAFSFLDAVPLAVAIFMGSLFIQLVLAGAGAVLGRVIADPRWIAGLNVLSGAGIVAFGVAGLVR